MTLLKIARKNLETCLDYKAPRMEQIKKYEDMYFGKNKPALKGRFNIPIPILEGYVQTLESKIDDQIKVIYKNSREATYKIGKKLTALWERDSAPDRGDYNGADLDAKKLAIFSGFGFLKLIPSVSYRQDLEAIDYHDAIFEPFGGRVLDNHLFKGQINIFKTKKQLLDGIGKYNKNKVAELIRTFAESDTKKILDQTENKVNRYLAMGLNPKGYNYVGTDVYNFCEMVLKYEGEDWYILFNYEKNIAIREVPLKEIGDSPFVAWHTDRNPVSFLGRSPLDGIYSVAEAMRILINQNFDNIQKRNWDMVLYNARKILDPSQFEYRPNGLIRVKLEAGESMNSAYQKMETPDTSTITINLMQWLNAFLGEKSGITPGTQGNAEEDKVGIYYGNIQQSADRFGLLNKFYTQAHIDIAKKYKENAKRYAPSGGLAVKYTGMFGLKEDVLTKEEIDEEMEVSIISANVESKNDEITRKKQQESLDRVLARPELYAQVGKKWLLEEVLRIGDYSEEKIKNATLPDGGDAELMSEAAQAIEMIIDGEKPKINRGANTAFIRKITNYAIEAETLDDNIFANLMSYAMEHLPIAERNAQLIMPMAPIENGQTPTI